MDDQHFDDFIKQKAEGYRESGVDPAAFADFQRRLDHLPGTPWYVRYRAAIGWAAAMALFTLINLGVVWYFNQSKDDRLQSQLAEMKVSQEQFQKLQAEIQYLRSLKTDTVYIYNTLTQNQSVTAPLSSGIVENGNGVNGGAYQTGGPAVAQAQIPPTAFVIAQDEGGKSFLKLGRYQDLPEEVQTFISQSGSISQDEQGNLYLPLDSQQKQRVRKRLAIGPDDLDGTAHPLAFATAEENVTASKEKQQLSGKVVRALEKQQYSGWGFQTGLEVQQYKGVHEVGNGGINTSVGLLGEFILSPRWRVEVGALHSNLRYEIDGFKDNAPLLAAVSGYPGYDGQLGDLNDAGISSTLLKLPANVKYYYPLAQRKRLYISAGLTPYLYLSQRFNYKYRETEDSGLETFLVSAKRVSQDKLYFGTANAGLGAEFDLNEKLKWQVGLYYEHGLADFGLEANRMQTFGLKSSLWLKVK